MASAPAAATSTYSSEPYVERKAPRLNHLGTRAHEHDARDYKFGRTFTVRYNQRPTAKTRGDLHYILATDAQRASHFSLLTLTRMHLTFREALERDAKLVGPKLFKHVMRKFHITDRLLVQRLFDGFSDYGSRVDYREFIRTFVCACNARVEEKLDLILDLYGTEAAGHLTLYELSMLIVKSREGEAGRVAVSPQVAKASVLMLPQPGIDIEAALDEETRAQVRRVWQEAKAAHDARDQSTHDADEWTSSRSYFGTPAGLGKAAFLTVCKNSPFVRRFFEHHLSLRPTRPKPRVAVGGIDESPLGPFYRRMGELEGEVLQFQLGENTSHQEAVGSGGGAAKPGVPGGMKGVSSLPQIASRSGVSASIEGGALGRSRGSTLSQGGKHSASSGSLATKSDAQFAWTASSLARRRVGTSVSTHALLRQQEKTKLEQLMPRRRAEHSAPLLSADSLHGYLNDTRGALGLNPLNGDVDHLIVAKRRGSPPKEQIVKIAISSKILTGEGIVTRPASSYGLPVMAPGKSVSAASLATSPLPSATATATATAAKSAQTTSALANSILAASGVSTPSTHPL